jgi:copper type II ascorbate-dependent monooxygenase-like protein
MRSPLARLLVGAVALTAIATSLTIATASATTPHRTWKVTPITISMANAYTPNPPSGATDDYHCSLVNPNVTQDSYIISSDFLPGDQDSTEVHHAILFLIPPSWAAAAEQANDNGAGWTCFGETILTHQQLQLPGSTASTNQPTWLTAWAPGHNVNVFPKGTGVFFPKGSLVVLQIHYNTLAGDAAIKSTLTVNTVSAKDPLKPLSLDLYPAPPDVPCLASWHPATTPLCSRANSLKYLAARFGQQAVDFVNGLEIICGRNPNDPPASDTTQCTWTVHQRAKIVELGAHMHLTGEAFKLTLDPGTSRQKVLLNVKNFNFDYQRGYAVKPWVQINPGDKIQVSCTYNPIVHDFNPQLRQAPRRFVTWGDGSSDEMCLGLVSTVSG